MLFASVALLIALWLATGALVAALRSQRRIDWLYCAVILPFAGLAGADLLALHGWLESERFIILSRLIYQLMILGVTVFLVVALRGGRPLARLLITVQTLAGLMLAVWRPLGGWGWEIFNITCGSALVLMLAHALWRRGGGRAWTVLLVAIAALGVMLTDLHSAGGAAIAISWAQLLYTPILFVVWLTLTHRIGGATGSRRHGGLAGLERQQLAQDLHDGVGSQLTTIISALDHGTPQERATAAALQEALIDLKLLVDGVDEEASVVSLLANLRYRTRPLLEAAGIELGWHVADEALLEQVQGPPAREILRIAQESLANVVHHSGGDAVTVTLCHMKAQDALWLEIADNGRGMSPDPGQAPRDTDSVPPATRPGGKGLPGMRRRARQLGGQLEVHSVPGEGTRVTLQVPLEHLVAETEA
ncbi:MAG TPA: ATP-binding protein [Ottowia sp.]|nr:ATP-binding protein [Ottowia sp.]